MSDLGGIAHSSQPAFQEGVTVITAIWIVPAPFQEGPHTLPQTGIFPSRFWGLGKMKILWYG